MLNISLIVERLTAPLACLLFLLATVETSVAQTGPSVLFIRGADRSGGFLEADDDAERTEQLAGINNTSTANGNHGWNELRLALEADGFQIDQMVEPVEAGAPATGQTTGTEIEFGNLDLSSYDVLVFGSNNAVYSEASIDAIESYIRGGGGAIFISDANFGSDWADASNSDQQFLDRFGLIVNQDRGTYSLERSDGEFLIPDDPLFAGVDRIDGEGVTPFQIGDLTTGVSADILALAEGETRLNNGTGGNNQGSTRAAGPNDAAILFVTADQGRLIGHFDRNTFFNDNGAGTNINRFDNQQYAINLFRAAAGPLPVLGDVNLDGVTDFLDISPFITLLASGQFQVEADINGDGVVNFLDISPFVVVLSGS